MMFRDTDLFEITASDDLVSLISHSKSLAQRLSQISVEQRATSIRGLEVRSTLSTLNTSDACALLFNIGKEFGQVDAGAGWAGLHDAAFGLVGHSLLPVAFLESYEDPNFPAIWHLITDCEPTKPFLHGIDWSAGQLYTWQPEAHEVRGSWAEGLKLQNLHGGRICSFSKKSPLETLDLSKSTMQVLCNAYYSTLAGLVVGACQSAAKESMLYSQTRMSAGKPIGLHQAVALRLSEIATQSTLLSLMCEKLSISSLWCQHLEYLDTISSMARVVVREALQVAAAHGYVEGLSFRRLHEQVHSICGLLSHSKKFFLVDRVD